MDMKAILNERERGGSAGPLNLQWPGWGLRLSFSTKSSKITILQLSGPFSQLTL